MNDSTRVEKGLATLKPLVPEEVFDKKAYARWLERVIQVMKKQGIF